MCPALGCIIIYPSPLPSSEGENTSHYSTKFCLCKKKKRITIYRSINKSTNKHSCILANYQLYNYFFFHFKLIRFSAGLCLWNRPWSNFGRVPSPFQRPPMSGYFSGIDERGPCPWCVLVLVLVLFLVYERRILIPLFSCRAPLVTCE